MIRYKLALGLLLIFGITAPVYSAPVPLEKRTATKDPEFEGPWCDMGWYHPNAVKFWCRVHANPKAGYAFLDRTIEPVQLSIAAAKQLIHDLDSNDEKKWKAARATLIVRDVRLAMNFLEAWQHAESDVQRQRLTSATYLFANNPEYYDVTLSPVQPPFARSNNTS